MIAKAYMSVALFGGNASKARLSDGNYSGAMYSGVISCFKVVE